MGRAKLAGALTLLLVLTGCPKFEASAKRRAQDATFAKAQVEMAAAAAAYMQAQGSPFDARTPREGFETRGPVGNYTVYFEPDATRKPRQEKFRMAREQGKWVVKLHVKGHQFLTAHPLAPPDPVQDVDRMGGYLDVMVAKHIEGELARTRPGAVVRSGYFDSWICSRSRDRAGVGECNVTYFLGEDLNPVERRFTFLKDESGWTFREMKPGEVFDRSTGEVRAEAAGD